MVGGPFDVLVVMVRLKANECSRSSLGENDTQG